MNFKKFYNSSECFNRILIGLVICLIGISVILFYRSYAIYEESKSFDVIGGSVPNQDYDVKISYYIDDGNKRFVSSIPDGNQWKVDVTCDKGAEGDWNYDTWRLEVTSTLSNTKCNLTFMPYQSVLEEYGINEMVRETGDGLYEVHHENTNILAPLSEEEKNNLKKVEYRYVGSNPKNYVRFNEELWRIIGLVNTPEGYRLKLIRDESIGDYSWDSSESSVNSGWGINSWPHADLMNVLNQGVYYNRTSGTCFNQTNNATEPCDFSKIGLLESSKEMIYTITWNIGSQGEGSHANFTADDFYYHERSNFTKFCVVSQHCNDTVERSVFWKGQVGLYYPSDYGYATGGGTLVSREMCLSKNIKIWNESRDCFLNNWLYIPYYNWTLFGALGIESSNVTVFISLTGGLSGSPSSNNLAVRPVVYLKNGYVVKQGDGTKSNPYIFAIS